MMVAFQKGPDLVTVAGNYDDYLRYCDQKARAVQPQTCTTGRTRQKSREKDRPRRLTWREKRELEGIENAIVAAETKLAGLQSAVNAPAFYRGPVDEVQRGAPLNGPTQPVVRVSWHDATVFCRWLSDKTGRHFTLPTEAQWEHACRAGTETPLWYGAVDDDFSPFANVSDASNHRVTSSVISVWRPVDSRFTDGQRVSAPVGSYRPNPWGLHDMHGNVAEWTRSDYRTGAAPRSPERSSHQPFCIGRKVVRGGSWDDRPKRCRSASRFGYPPDQAVFNVGFRVVCEENP